MLRVDVIARHMGLSLLREGTIYSFLVKCRQVREIYG